MTGAARADLFVSRIGCDSGGVSHLAADDAGRFPEHALGAPETAQPEHRLAQMRVGWIERPVVDPVRLGHLHPVLPAGQGVIGLRQFRLEWLGEHDQYSHPTLTTMPSACVSGFL